MVLRWMGGRPPFGRGPPHGPKRGPGAKLRPSCPSCHSPCLAASAAAAGLCGAAAVACGVSVLRNDLPGDAQLGRGRCEDARSLHRLDAAADLFVAGPLLLLGSLGVATAALGLLGARRPSGRPCLAVVSGALAVVGALSLAGCAALALLLAQLWPICPDPCSGAGNSETRCYWEGGDACRLGISWACQQWSRGAAGLLSVAGLAVLSLVAAPAVFSVTCCCGRCRCCRWPPGSLPGRRPPGGGDGDSSQEERSSTARAGAHVIGKSTEWDDDTSEF